MNPKIIFLLITVFYFHNACSRERDNSSQDQNNTAMNTSYDTATFGSGCYWCTEAIFQRLEGVISVESGFSGGHVKNPTYKEVCTGTTGHAEVCRITYNPSVIDYIELLEVFWKTHDPTTLNRQGNDVGTQYRSVIFYHNQRQKDIALEMKGKLSVAHIWEDPIVTEISPFEAFYKAQDYHQDYYNQNKSQAYCRFVITPKIEKFEKIFREKLKKSSTNHTLTD
ncbi:MAG: peptide-methionine (S)-S-oxide reductase MsrA [Bacteroidales bacterium]|nr:peptide-methionine (S)-S-oxide reductase MsrA [Bacteroidales bacterium]